MIISICCPLVVYCDSAVTECEARFPSKRNARNASDCVWMETGLQSDLLYKTREKTVAEEWWRWWLYVVVVDQFTQPLADWTGLQLGRFTRARRAVLVIIHPFVTQWSRFIHRANATTITAAAAAAAAGDVLKSVQHVFRRQIASTRNCEDTIK